MKELFQLLVIFVMVLLSAIGLHYSFWRILQDTKKNEIQVVNQPVPATDDQLVEFWFGNGDKAALRKRICR